MELLGAEWHAQDPLRCDEWIELNCHVSAKPPSGLFYRGFLGLTLILNVLNVD